MTLVLLIVGIALCIHSMAEHARQQNQKREQEERDAVIPRVRMYGGKVYAYTKQRTPTCLYYFNGGYRDGQFFQAGYYSEPFWKTWGTDNDGVADGRASHGGGGI